MMSEEKTAFVVFDPQHMPSRAYVVPNCQLTSHAISQIHLAAESVGKYVVRVEVIEKDAFGTQLELRKLPKQDGYTDLVKTK